MENQLTTLSEPGAVATGSYRAANLVEMTDVVF